MKINKILFFLMLTMLIRPLNALDWSRKDLWNLNADKYDLIEPVKRYNTVFNWSRGVVRTELFIPLGDEDPNVGRMLDNAEAELKEDLRQNLIKSLGALRISDLFLLKDYYSLKNEIRYEIIAKADLARYYPPVQSKGRLYGRVELKIFGKGGLANLFYRDIEKVNLRETMRHPSVAKNEWYDTVILDTIIFPQFKPSVNLRILDENGRVIYGPGVMDRNALYSHGICHYTTSLMKAFDSPYTGNRVFYIIPLRVTGKMKTDLVLYHEDADMLLSNPKTIEALKKGRVIVVKPESEK